MFSTPLPALLLLRKLLLKNLVPKLEKALIPDVREPRTHKWKGRQNRI
jgi:hypothetical protein